MTTLEVSRVVPIGARYLEVTTTPGATYPFAAGQHLVLHLEDAAGAFARAYSIASAPGGDVELCLPLAGDGRAAAVFGALAPGARLDASEPRGAFRMTPRGRPIVAVAGGSGIAPLRAMLADLTRRADVVPPITIVYGCRDAAEMPYLDAVAAIPGVTLDAVAETGHRRGVARGTVLEALARRACAGADYYLCGPRPMLDAVRAELARLRDVQVLVDAA